MMKPSLPSDMSRELHMVPALASLCRELRFVAWIVLILAAGVPMQRSSAATDVTYLGPQGNNLSDFPLSGFHRVKGRLITTSRPTIFFIGTMARQDLRSALERWPLLKALDQFGTFSTVSPVASVYSSPMHEPSYATFDISQAQYRSRYITLDHRDLLNANLHLYQPMSVPERRLYEAYARAAPTGLRYDPDRIISTLDNYNVTQRTFPLIYIQGYAQTVSQVVISGDFDEPLVVTPTPHVGFEFAKPLSFDAVRSALVTGKDPFGTKLVEDVDTETNILTALICHATHVQPRSVCSRSAIKTILHHVK